MSDDVCANCGLVELAHKRVAPYSPSTAEFSHGCTAYLPPRPVPEEARSMKEKTMGLADKVRALADEWEALDMGTGLYPEDSAHRDAHEDRAQSCAQQLRALLATVPAPHAEAEARDETHAELVALIGNVLRSEDWELYARALADELIDAGFNRGRGDRGN